MDLSALEIFADVVRTRSFSSVARERGVGPSAISRVIAALETKIGARLFNRSTRRLVPTEAALAFRERIEPHLQGLRVAVEAIGAGTEHVAGSLRVTASTSFGIERLAPLLAEFAARYPALGVELTLTDRVVDIIGERFDLAVRHGPLQDSSLIAQPLTATRYYAVASPGYVREHGRPAVPADLAAHACLTFPLPGFASFWRFRDAEGRIEEARVSGRIVVNSGIALRRCALDGAGIALLSDWLVDGDLAAGRLVDVFPEQRATPTNFETAISAVYPSRKLVPRRVRSLIDFLRERF